MNGANSAEVFGALYATALGKLVRVCLVLSFCTGMAFGFYIAIGA